MKQCPTCHGDGYTNEGDPEIGNALFDCTTCGGSGCVPAGAVPTVPAMAVAPTVPPSQGELPRHQFWGAGEPDCPPELKAPNGELHTMRCKVCGDGWRKSGNVCLPLDPARVALAELVACKDLKDRAEAVSFAGPLSEFGEGWKAEYDRMRADYLRRQPIAWEAARRALGVTRPDDETPCTGKTK